MSRCSLRLIAVGLVTVAWPLVIAIRHSNYYLNVPTILVFGGAIAYVVWTVFTAARVSGSQEAAWQYVQRVEEGCNAILLALSIFFGLIQVFGTLDFGLPPHGFDLVLLSGAFTILGLVPYPPFLAAGTPQAILRQIGARRATKALWLGGAAFALAVVVINLQRFDREF